MSNDIALGSRDEEPDHDHQTSGAPKDKRPKGAAQRRQKKREVPTTEDCLRAIAALPGLVATRVLTNSQANAIRGSYESILRHHERSQYAPTQQVSDDSVLKVVRAQPELLQLLQPFFTSDQLGIIMEEFRQDDADGEV